MLVSIILLCASISTISGWSNKDSVIAECIIFPNDILNPHDPQFKSGELDNVRGKLVLSTEMDGTRIKGEISGLVPNQKHGFHIHALGDLSDGCSSAGPHFNPFDKSHGGPDDKERHVGDLGNIKADKNGVAKIDILDSLVTLNGDYSVIGLAMVVHEDPDNFKTQPTGGSGGRPGCGVIGIRSEADSGSYGNDNDNKYKEEVEFASAVLLINENDQSDNGYDHNELYGFIDIEVVNNGKEVIICASIYGLSPYSVHGFHIHELGSIDGDCLSAGPHYNPFNKKHGGPHDKERHNGDLGNIEADSDGIAHIDISDSAVKLNGETSVIGRSFVVHENEDDLSPDSDTGNSGGRILCGIIGISSNDDEDDDKW